MKQYGLFFAWMIALLAMLGTLFASEILHWPVCVLCWYQRICIYPLVILLGIAAFKNDSAIVPYAMPFPALGFLFALYQYLEQMIPGFGPIHLCGTDISCATTQMKWLGFITLPFLSMVACVSIVVLIALSRRVI